MAFWGLRALQGLENMAENMVENPVKNVGNCTIQTIEGNCPRLVPVVPGTPGRKSPVNLPFYECDTQMVRLVDLCEAETPR